MSQDFIQFGFPCIDCLVSAACQDKKHVERKDFLDRAGGIRCLALPEYDKQTSSHQKSLLECVANIIWDCACSLNEDRGMKIPEQYRHFLMEYLGIFQYIINTTSWNTNINPVADFDRLEIKSRLDFASRLLDWVGDPILKE
jgi:hypothetical protein